MYNKTNWTDHVMSPPNTFKVTDNSDGTKKIERSGDVIQQGTPMSATNFNNAEEGILAAYLTAAEAMLVTKQASGAMQMSVIKGVELTNTANYPFNSSEKTIALSAENERTSSDYMVFAEVVKSRVAYRTYKGDGSGNYSYNDYSGKNAKLGVGDIVIYDKLTNAFKVAFSGDAMSATVNFYIIGGK